MLEFFEKDNLMFLLTLVSVLIAMIVCVTLLFRKKETKETPYDETIDEYVEKHRLAKPASAFILSVGKNKPMGNEQIAVELKLEVHSPNNKKYNTEVSWLVDSNEMKNIKQGETINVKVDAFDDKIIYHSSEKIRLWQWD